MQVGFLALTFEPWSFVFVVKLIYVLENGPEYKFQLTSDRKKSL